MSIVRALIPSVILPLTLMAGGCNNKPEPETKAPVAAVSEPISLVSLSRKDFEKSLNVKPQSIKPASANAALERLDLAKSSEGKFFWSEKSGGNGQYTYKNLNVRSEDGHLVNIGVLELTNVRMDNDSPYFDRADMKNVTITAPDSAVTIGNISLSDPSPEFSRSLMEAIEKIDDMRNLRRLDLDLNMGIEGKAFGAILMDNILVDGKGGSAGLKTLGWREDAKTGKAAFLLERFLATSQETSDSPETKISIGSVSGTGLDAKAFRDIQSDDKTHKQSVFDLFGYYAPAAADIAVKDIMVQSSTMTAQTEGVISRSIHRGDNTEVQQVLKPLTLSFSGQPEGGDAYRLWEGVKGAGYEDLIISGSHTVNVDNAAKAFSITNGNLSLKDGFKLDYTLSGQTAAGIDDTTLTGLTLNLTDQSIVDRAFTYFALQQGKTPSKAKMQAKGALMLGGAAAAFMAPSGEDQAAITQTVNSLAGFIDQGGQLQIALNPQAPLTLEDMQNIDPMSASPKQFGLTVNHIK